MPFTAEQMFSLVDDIPKYSGFLPWCRSTTVLERDDTEVKACIDIAKAGIHKSFTTRNQNHRPNRIEMSLIEGPFKHLEGLWRFDSLNDRACKVSLDIEFEFSNKLLEKTIGPIFGHICNTLVEAFVKRAQEVYGKK